MGPVLLFRGCNGKEWRLSATHLLPEGDPPPPLRAGGVTVAAVPLATIFGHRLWRYDFAFPLASAPATAEYILGDARYAVALPASGGEIGIAFTACNGQEAGEKEWPGPRNERWSHLLATQSERPMHLLLQGGDQIYADGMWREIKELAAWDGLRNRQKAKAPWPPELPDKLRRFFFDTYRATWEQPEVAAAMSRIPSLMMWDDHDITDGWGSHHPAKQASPVFQAIFAAAREAFALFQLGARPDALPDGFVRRDGRHFGWSYRIGSLGLVAPDLRSRRTPTRILDDETFRDLAGQLDALAGCRQLLVVSSVPAINADLSAIEWLLFRIPRYQASQDDPRDQWQSYAHRREWLRFLDLLLRFSERNAAEVLIASGEIHLGCYGTARRAGLVLHQLTSSGIVHPPPPAAVMRLLHWMAGRQQTLDDGIAVDIPPIFRGWRYLAERNWLELRLPAAGGAIASWHAETSGILTLPLPATAKPGSWPAAA